MDACLACGHAYVVQGRDYHWITLIVGANRSVWVSTRDARIYCVLFPCSYCCKAIIQAGIRKVIYEEDYNDPLSKMLFEEAGVELVRITAQEEASPLPNFGERN